MKKNNPFCKNKRIVHLFDNLKRDIAGSDGDNILNSLPQFFRMALIERGNKWAEFFNTYDLLFMVGVHCHFPDSLSVDQTYDAAIRIVPETTKIKHIEVNDFIATTLIQSNARSYTVQDFVLAIAYNGTFHLEPKDRPELAQLYNEFIVKHYELSLKLANEIGNCLVQCFQPLRESKDGRKDAFNTVNHRQPMACQNGSIVTFSNGHPASRFHDAYLQSAIREMPNHGIRICLDIQLTGLQNIGCILTYGHRDYGAIIGLKYNSGAILALARNDTEETCVPIKQIPAFEIRPHKLELALYPCGDFVVAVDEQLFKKEQVGRSFQIKSGKLIIGTDLNADNAGSFLCACTSIEAIDSSHTVSDIQLCGSRQVLSNAGMKIEPTLFSRPALR